MNINFLTASLSDETGGTAYDKNFFRILKEVYPCVNLYDDNYFLSRNTQGGGGLLNFNKYYRASIPELFNCDYFITNSRQYTRMLLINFRRLRKTYPNTKFIVIHHHSNFMNHSGIRRLIHRHLELRVLRAASTLLIPNQSVIDQLASDFGINNVCHLPLAFDKRQYEVSSLDNKRLLFVGTVEPRKGLIYGLEAFKVIHDCLPSYKYHVVGKTPTNHKDYYDMLLQYVRDNKLEDSVIFEGRVSEERLDWLYSHSDIFLFPSLLEGYGMVIAEAMARGIPVVAFNNSAMPYTIKDDYNGLLIDNKNAELMGKRVCELLKDRSRLLRLQEGALRTFESVPDINDLNLMTRKYIETWR